MNDNLDPPPSRVSVFNGQWIRWQYNLYEWIQGNMNKDPWVEHAINVIAATYGDKVSIDAKNKDLVKFGRVSLDTGSTIHTVEIQPHSSIQNETFLSANTIDYIVSSSASDIAANNSSDGTLEGFTDDGSGNLTFVSQPVVLTGQTPALLGTPLARATRWYNNDSAETVGKISVYESSVTTITAGAPSAGYTGVHLTVDAGKQNSEKCSTSISSVDYWIITGVYGDVLSKLAEDVSFLFEVRLQGKVFREWFQFSASNGVGTFRASHPYVIIPPNSDVRIRALGDATTGIIVAAGMFGALAKVV